MADDPIIDSRGAFHTAVAAGFAEAASVGCRELIISDTDFGDWPLSERAVIESLTQWAQAHRRLTVVATQFDTVVLKHARWVAWRRTWSHVVECRVNDELEAGQMPTLLLAPGLLGLRLVDPLRYRGRVSHERPDLLLWAEEIDAVLQRSVPSFPATTLGL
jgi:hypothetical protein